MDGALRKRHAAAPLVGVQGAGYSFDGYYSVQSPSPAGRVRIPRSFPSSERALAHNPGGDVMADRPRFWKYRRRRKRIWTPEQRGRILVQVPAVYKDSVSGWAEPCLPLVGIRSGLLALPQVGAKVWIEFEQATPAPIWCGGFGPLVRPHRPLRRCKPCFQTTGGNVILIDDTPGWAGSRSRPLRGYVQSHRRPGSRCKPSPGKIEVSPVGITIQSAAGHSIMIRNAAGICLSTSTGATS